MKIKGVPFGITDPVNTFDSFFNLGKEMLSNIRDYVANPETRKKARTWGALDAAKMVQVSAPTFRKLIENNPELPGVQITESSNGNKTKKYTLEAINALRRLANTKYTRPKNSTPLTIAISNLKGGVGKTETSVDLAKKCAIEGLNTLLLDFDAQATATLLTTGLIPDLELGYDDTITHALLNKPSDLHKVIKSTTFDGLHIVPANLGIQDCDLNLPGSTDEETINRIGSPYHRLLNALESVKDKYDVILLDCGPNIGMLTLNALVACDGMIVPIPPNMYDYASFISYSATLNALFTNLSDKQLRYFRILLSKHNGKNEAIQMESIMRTQFTHYVLSKHMCETEEVSKAGNEICSVYDITTPRGSRSTYKRAIQHLDDVNTEIINHFKSLWEDESLSSVETSNQLMETA